MASETVRQIKEKISIVDVVSQYVKLERTGATLKARCPFHAERTPSFHVSADRGTYHCFGCGVGGDIFTFVQGIEGTDFNGALKILADKAGVSIVYEKAENRDARDRLLEIMEVSTMFYISRMTGEALAYLKDRGMTTETIKDFRLGWAGNGWSDAADHLRGKGFSQAEIIEAGMGKQGERGTLDKFRNRIMFPLCDTVGRVVAFSGRIFGPDASPEAPKYLNSPETPLFHKSRMLYGFDKAKIPMRKHNSAILVEGQMDLLASHQAGWGNTVAVSGTAFTTEHAQLIHRMTDNLVIALDADAAGIKAAGKASREAMKNGLNVKVTRLPTGMDPADLIAKEGVEAWSAAIRNATDIITFMLDVLEEHSKAPDAFRRAVEIAVLPYLADVQSPIAREQYIREIANRLKVSEAAVAEAYRKAPRDAQVQPATSVAVPKAPVLKLDRMRVAYSIQLWQSALERPSIAPSDYASDLERIIGSEKYQELQEMSETEKEALRFAAEERYAKTMSLKGDATTLLKELEKEIRLPQIREEINEAERLDDFEAMKRLQEEQRRIQG